MNNKDNWGSYMFFRGYKHIYDDDDVRKRKLRANPLPRVSKPVTSLTYKYHNGEHFFLFGGGRGV